MWGGMEVIVRCGQRVGAEPRWPTTRGEMSNELWREAVGRHLAAYSWVSYQENFLGLIRWAGDAVCRKRGLPIQGLMESGGLPYLEEVG